MLLTYMFDVMFAAKRMETLVDILDNTRMLYRNNSVGSDSQPVS